MLESDVCDLGNMFGAENVLTDRDSLQFYGCDKTTCFNPNPKAILFPRSEDDVVAITRWANKTQTSLVPSGGRTGYSGAAVAANGEVVVSFEKMNAILELNADESLLRVQPGVVTQTIQEKALKAGLYYPVDFASSGSSQIGGNVATNAGGIKVIRYGLTREWVSGLRVVTGAGEVLNLDRGLIKDASGFDLKNLFIGSEGTLGFITEVTLKLTTPPVNTQVFLFAIDDLACITNLLNIFRQHFDVMAFEFFTNAALAYSLSVTKLNNPFQKCTAYYVLIECDIFDMVKEALVDKLVKATADIPIVDVVVANSLSQAKNLWRLREEISMALLPCHPYKYDLSVKLSKIPAFIKQMDLELAKVYPDCEVIWFGHVGDGNLHLNILKPEALSDKQFCDSCEKNSGRVYQVVQDFGGSVAAEHGVGLLKKKYLHFTRSQTEIDYMRSIKTVFDPNDIMNPGKVFD